MKVFDFDPYFLEAVYVAQDMDLKKSDILTGAINRCGYILSVYEIPVPTPQHLPYILIGPLFCEPRTLRCSGISGHVQEDDTWLHTVRLEYRPHAVWGDLDWRNKMKVVSGQKPVVFKVYQERRFECHLSNSLKWKVK